MALSYPRRTALMTCVLVLLLGPAACATRHVDVAFSIPAQHALPGVASIAVGPFTGDAGEDAADLLYYSLERADHFAVFRQQPDASSAGPDNFGVAADIGRSACAGQHADAILYGAVRPTPSQVSYTVKVQPVLSLPQPSQEHSFPAYETRICRQQQQSVSVVLKVSLRQGRRDHLCLTAQHTYQPPTECVYAPGQVSMLEAPFYFTPLGPPTVHVPSLMSAIDALANDLVPRRVTEPMVIYYDHRVPLSDQALAAASDGDWALASALYEQGIEDVVNRGISLKARGRLHYNLAIALAAQGHFVRALRHMEIAEVAETSKVYIAARVRILHYQEQARLSASERERLGQMRQTLSCKLRSPN